MDELTDYIPRYCTHCDEEYQLPEDLERCPICDHTIEEED